MKMEELGYNGQIEELRKAHGLEDFEIGRVVAEHKERYIVKTEQAELEAEITGNLRFTAGGREDFAAVGDWVTVMTYDDTAIIHNILPRLSVISRQAVGHHGETQIIASNIDCAFLLQAVDRDFNINRLERYLTICHASKVRPVIVLTKTDLITKERLHEITGNIKQRLKDIPLIAISNETRDGYASLKQLIR